MLKFSRRHKSTALSERTSPENRMSKRQRTDDDATESDPSEETDNSRLSTEIAKLQQTHAEFEKFLDMVSGDLKVKVEKQRLLKETDKNYAGVQLFMLTKYSNRIERFRQVSRTNLDSILDSSHDKENADIILEHVAKHVEAVGKMKRRSKQILDISDKYAVEDIFDNINLVNECSASLASSHSSSSDRSHHPKMSKWRSIGVLSAASRRVEPVPVETPVLAMDDTGLRPPSVELRSSRASTSSSTSSRHSKLSTFLSLTDHLAVLTKTYTGRR